jgi:Na+/H+ antiporter NhaD/arsenite permease-like protein
MQRDGERGHEDLMRKCAWVGLGLIFIPASGTSARAANALPGDALGWPWAIPFAGVLMTIALGPLLFSHFWHRHYGKIAGAWAVLALAAIAAEFGIAAAVSSLVHTTLAEYLSFILLLFALYTVAGGILVTGNVHGTPRSNTAMLALGMVMASFVGTTGAAMIMIRPLLRANDERRYNVHVVVFFIFLVANVGGSLTPLGDPPLFVGFLRGVDFFWTATTILWETAIVASLLLTVFYVLDSWLARREELYQRQKDPTPPVPFQVTGFVNLLLIGAIIGAILLSANWRPGVVFSVLGTQVELQNLVRDALLVAIALLSLWWTREEQREANGFSWEPIKEVAKLFAAIFITIAPVLAMLHAGESGAFAPLLALVSGADGSPDPAAYFWLTGALSAFLDNAPTYIVFFELAGGDAQELMGPLAHVLAAISMGAVYMGALTYIGNAPNLMVYAVAVERGVRMPSFFGYMLWSLTILLPIFLLLTVLSISG